MEELPTPNVRFTISREYRKRLAGYVQGLGAGPREWQFPLGAHVRHLSIIVILLAALAVPALAQTPHDHHAALNERGRKFMGFDQLKTAHHFILERDGGRIQVTANDANDAESIRQIREHLKHIAAVFAKGDFDLPALIHDTKAVPGVQAMKTQGGAVSFTFEESDRGGHVRITGSSPEAIAAVHEFLRFQITDHKTGDPLVVR